MGEGWSEGIKPHILQLRKHFARRVDGVVDIFFAVRHGHKARFERGRRQVHAFFQHQVEEALEAFNVALHHVLIAGHGFRIGEEDFTRDRRLRLVPAADVRGYIEYVRSQAATA